MNLKTLFPNASPSFLQANSPQLATEKPQPIKRSPLVPGLQGTKQMLGRVKVCYRGYFVRPQDTDNFAGATKPSTDYLRRVGLLPGDEPWKIALSWEQEKVKTFAEEKIEITITYPKK